MKNITTPLGDYPRSLNRRKQTYTGDILTCVFIGIFFLGMTVLNAASFAIVQTDDFFKACVFSTSLLAISIGLEFLLVGASKQVKKTVRLFLGIVWFIGAFGMIGGFAMSYVYEAPLDALLEASNYWKPIFFVCQLLSELTLVSLVMMRVEVMREMRRNPEVNAYLPWLNEQQQVLNLEDDVDDREAVRNARESAMFKERYRREQEFLKALSNN